MGEDNEFVPCAAQDFLEQRTGKPLRTHRGQLAIPAVGVGRGLGPVGWAVVIPELDHFRRLFQL